MDSSRDLLELVAINNYLVNFNCQDYHVHLFQELNSTNSYILEHIGYLKDNDIVITEIQTLGRGRFDNKWFSEPSVGLTFSVLKFFDKNINLDTLPLILSIAIKRLLNEFHVPNKIKWPNDILHPDGSKIAGILLESGFKNNKRFVVVGVGINDNFNVERNLFFASLLKHVDELIKEFSLNGFESSKSEWLEACIHYNKSIGLYQNGNLLASGVNIGLSEYGAILIKLDNGDTKDFISGSIRFEIFS